MKYALAVAFLATVLAANYVTAELGVIPLGFGATVAAGTWFAGLALVLRDGLHEAFRPHAIPVVFGLIAAGGLLSYAVSPAALALASGVTFAVSETADLAAYAPLRRRSKAAAVLASGVVGSVVDSWLFLTLAEPVLGPMTTELLVGQIAVKTLLSLVVALVLVVRDRRVAA